jgi:hypothetical protein
MIPKNIPQDISADILLDYFPKGSCKIALKGHHKRNVYKDIIQMEDNPDGTFTLGVGRDGLYHALPEYLFHPVDRFNHLPRLEEKERFAEECDKQKQEVEHAYKFFAPIDIQLLLLRVETLNRLRELTEDNKVLIDILGDRITEEQRQNRFISQTIPFLPYCKQIRGNKTLLTLMLRKIFMVEGMSIMLKEKNMECHDTSPRYYDGLDSSLNDGFVGNVYDEQITSYDIHYWSAEECNEHFLKFVDEMEMFRLFIKDYFISIEEDLHFDIVNDEVPLRLSDNNLYNYLDYNTNI